MKNYECYKWGADAMARDLAERADTLEMDELLEQIEAITVVIDRAKFEQRFEQQYEETNKS